MFRFIKEVFIALLSFCKSLATKLTSLNDDPCMIRPTLVDLNSIELNHYSFMTSVDKCNGSCALSKTKDINIKVFNMITRINEVNTLVKHISFDFKCKFDHAVCSLNQKWSSDKCHCDCKEYRPSKKYYS